MRERNPDHPTNAYAISRRVKRRRGSSPAANEKDLEGLNTFPLSGFLIHSFDITPGICAPLKHGREFPGPVAILASRQLPLDVSADSNIRINPFRRSFVCVYKKGGAENLRGILKISKGKRMCPTTSMSPQNCCSSAGQ